MTKPNEPNVKKMTGSVHRNALNTTARAHALEIMGRHAAKLLVSVPSAFAVAAVRTKETLAAAMTPVAAPILVRVDNNVVPLRAQLQGRTSRSSAPRYDA